MFLSSENTTKAPLLNRVRLPIKSPKTQTEKAYPALHCFFHYFLLLIHPFIGSKVNKSYGQLVNSGFKVDR